MSAANPIRPVVVHRDRQKPVALVRLIPAAILSALFHASLIGLMFLLGSPSQAEVPTERAARANDVPIQTEMLPDNHTDFLLSTVDPNVLDPTVELNLLDVPRMDDFVVPGRVQPAEKVGTENANKDLPPTSTPLPAGFGNGTGGVRENPNLPGTSGGAAGLVGGMTPRGVPLPGSIHGRSAAARPGALRDGGGTTASEAAVNRGLAWIARNQHPEGKWQLDGNFPDRGQANDIAGTALGLLPLLGAGKTHKAAKDNEYDKPIEKALAFLIRRQDKRTGNLGGGMYAHGLATIALCEAYGLTQDPYLKRPAQLAINYIIAAQHTSGGWRYTPGQAGDTSVAGWQIMALKSAQMAGLEVPERNMRKAAEFLDSVCNKGTEGYGYVDGSATPPMSAVGLLCRQYLQAWGPQNIRLIKGIDNNLKPTPPAAIKNIYYYYYATQVLHHFGGETWKDWNVKMRDHLIATQQPNGRDDGSWSSVGDAHGPAGGRLMQTSLSILTLEVYYRHLPLYSREMAASASQ